MLAGASGTAGSTGAVSTGEGGVAIESAADFAARVESGAYDDGVGARVRMIGAVEPELTGAIAQRPEVAVVDDAVTGSGRVELRYFVQEQAVSMTLHRFGNPSRSFHALAESLCPDRRAG